jgi:hypothetical protein
MTGFTQVRLQRLAKFESGVVGGDVNTHAPTLEASRG